MMKVISTVTAIMVSAMAVAADPVSIVTDIRPVAALAQRLAGPQAQVETLADQQASVHHFQLKPSQARRLADADLVVWVGPMLNVRFGEIFEQLDLKNILVLQDVDGLIKRRTRAGLPLGEIEEHDAHHEETDHTDHTDHQDHADHDDMHDRDADHDDSGHHDHGPTDAHMWLDLRNLAIFANAIAQELIALTPENSDTVMERLAELEAELGALQVSLGNGDTVPRARLFDHDAYQYFEAAYVAGLSAALSDHDDAPLRPQHLQAVRAYVETHSIPCVINAPGAAIGDAGLGLRVEIADAIGADIPLDNDYFATLFGNLAKVFESCAAPSF